MLCQAFISHSISYKACYTRKKIDSPEISLSAIMTTAIQRPLGMDTVVNTISVGPVNGQQVSVDNSTLEGHEQSTLSDTKTMDVTINNVVCSFSTKCHLNLKRIAMEGSNVEYHRQHGVRTLG